MVIKNKVRISHTGAFGQLIQIDFKTKARADQYYKRLKKQNIKSVYQRLR